MTAKKESKGDQLWNQIKNLRMEIFGLPNQTVEMHVQRHNVDPDCVYMTLKAGAVLPALEEALRQADPGKGKRFDLSQVDRYTVLKVVQDQYF